jgi:phosphatidate cytidylyltransferase
VKLWTANEEKENAPLHSDELLHQEQQLKQKKLRNRIVFGTGIGAALLGIVLAGGWVFTLAFAWTIWVGTGEYFELLRCKGNVASGMTPPPHIAEKVCAAICSLMPIMTL